MLIHSFTLGGHSLQVAEGPHSDAWDELHLLHTELLARGIYWETEGPFAHAADIERDVEYSASFCRPVRRAAKPA